MQHEATREGAWLHAFATDSARNSCKRECTSKRQSVLLVSLCLAVLQLCFSGPWSRMASKALSSKGSEELVGQELARSLWAQNLAEAEAELKKASDGCFSFQSKTLERCM